MSVKAWVMVPLRFKRPAPYLATLDAQWDLLSLYFPWSCAAIVFYSLESVLLLWEYRQTFCVLTCAAPVRRANQTQSHDCVYQRFIGFPPCYYNPEHFMSLIFLFSSCPSSLFYFQPHEASRGPIRICSGGSASVFLIFFYDYAVYSSALCLGVF